MPFNGSGVFTRTMNWVSDATAGIRIRADRHDTEDDNLAGGLSNVICRDGQSVITAHIPFNGNRIINLGNPVADQDAVTLYTLTKQPLTIGGNDAQGQLKFNGTESDPTAGRPLGLSFAQADLFFGVRKASAPPGVDGSTKNRWIWNDNATGTGTTVARLDETGNLDVGQIGSTGGSAGGGLTLWAASTLPQGDAIKSAALALRAGGYGTASERNSVQIYTGGTTGGTATLGVCAFFSADKSLTVTSHVTSGGNITAATNFLSSNATVLLAPASAGNIIFRPNGAGSATGQCTIDPSGDFIGGDRIYSTTGVFAATGAGVVLSAQGGTVFLRPNGEGSATNQAYLDTAGNLFASAGIYAGGIVQSTGGEMRIIATSGGQATLSFYQPGGGAVAGTCYWTSAGGGQVVLQNNYAGTGYLTVAPNGNISISGTTAFKVGGGSWTAPASDARVKEVLGDYQPGLAEVRQLHPVRYRFKGNVTGEAAGISMHAEISDQEFVGLIAQDVEPLMPGMVSLTSAYIDGEPVDDLRQLNTSELIYALCNSVRELADRIDTLEAA
jgi:hypothetical protein